MLEVETIHAIAYRAGAEVGEQIILPARVAKIASVPIELNPLVARRISTLYPHGLYVHQAIAIGSGLDGRSVCLATPTASGKTLTFTSVCVSLLLDDPGSVVLALYPAKALLHDQLQKWRQAVDGTSIQVGIIDGGVEITFRTDILRKARIILMTPDVLHAWMMARLAEAEIRKFLGALKLVVLDEAHIYDGVFGTNMAYLLRRLQAVSGVDQFLASSATIGDPAGFLKLLAGRDFELIDADQDGAAVPEKSVTVCRAPIRKVVRLVNELVKEYAKSGHGRFLIFADSRKRVEELAGDGHAAITTPVAADENTETDIDHVEEIDDVLVCIAARRVLPYRAGYEEEDRNAIQNALTNGSLLGVVTTSALELGIDIGDIELVVLLGTPPSVKSFWQRAGRAGRLKAGQIILIDLDGRVTAMGLECYLARTPEPNWLYLDNEYLQYANALCAAEEKLQALPPLYSRLPFAALPKSFLDLLENELEPTRAIPSELYPLKQQAVAGPHRAFPLRSGIERSYQVSCRHLPGMRLGSLSYSQVLREAFPGAIYRYMARPYRVFELKHPSGEIVCAKTKGITRTNAIAQTAVFPQFNNEMYYIRRSEDAFIAECKLQVSERVIGFKQMHGLNKIEILYGPGNQYSQKPLTRYINTTGVCCYFPNEALQRELLGKYLALAFCRVCSVHDRDVGWGTFISQISPLGVGPIRGFAVYDSAFGSMRLTRQLPQQLPQILKEVSRIAIAEGAPQVASEAGEMLCLLETFGSPQEHVSSSDIFAATEPDEEWKTVVAANQQAICHDGQSHINEDVLVVRYVFTPQGIRYTLKAARDDVQWQVSAVMIHPIHGVTKLEQYNVNTGETRDLPE